MIDMGSEINTVDLFSGAGGLTLGFERAGFNTLAANEIYEDACKTYRANFPDVTCVQKDINKLTAEELMNKAEFEPEDVDAVIGGPPCKGFSIAGERKPDDPRNALFEEYLRIVSKLNPKVILMENVPGILSMKDGAYVEKIKKEMRNLGYTVKHRKLNAADYGVPELRERIIFLGYKEGYEVSFPEATHTGGESQQKSSDNGLKPYVTVESAIGDLDFLCSGQESEIYEKDSRTHYQKKMRENSESLHNHKASNHSERIQKRFELIDEGKGMETVPEEYRTKKHSVQKFDRKEPSPTITTLPEDFVHYKRNRIPTVREVARIQSFPDDFVFKGPRTTGGKRRRVSVPQYSQIGNAVPPLMAEALAEELKKPFNN